MPTQLTADHPGVRLPIKAPSIGHRSVVGMNFTKNTSRRRRAAWLCPGLVQARGPHADRPGSAMKLLGVRTDHATRTDKHRTHTEHTRVGGWAHKRVCERAGLSRQTVCTTTVTPQLESDHQSVACAQTRACARAQRWGAYACRARTGGTRPGYACVHDHSHTTVGE